MKHLLLAILSLFSLLCSAQIELPRHKSTTTITNTAARYTYNYDPLNLTPRWVAYKLTSSDIGAGAGRAPSFYIDTAIIARGYPYATNADYAHSGFDKGHMLPSADRSRTVAENRATFIFGNIAPQTPALNRGVWKLLEEHIRRLTASCDTIYIVCGPITPPHAPTIGSGVAIPTLFFKALAIRTKDRFSFKAYVMPNSEPKREFSSYEVSVDSVEQLTGLLLFDNAPKRKL